MRFNDMTPEQKAKAVEINRGIYTSDDSWYDDEYKEMTERLADMGFGEVELGFSGFCSQGDGASFTTDNVNIEKVLRHFKVWSQYRPIHNMIRNGEISYKIYRINCRYIHEHTMRIDDSHYYQDVTTKQQNALNAMYEEISSIARVQAVRIYRELESLANGYETDEFISEYLGMNEYDFCERTFQII